LAFGKGCLGCKDGLASNYAEEDNLGFQCLRIGEVVIRIL